MNCDVECDTVYLIRSIEAVREDRWNSLYFSIQRVVITRWVDWDRLEIPLCLCLFFSLVLLVPPLSLPFSLSLSLLIYSLLSECSEERHWEDKGGFKTDPSPSWTNKWHLHLITNLILSSARFHLTIHISLSQISTISYNMSKAYNSYLERTRKQYMQLSLDKNHYYSRHKRH